MGNSLIPRGQSVLRNVKIASEKARCCILQTTVYPYAVFNFLSFVC